MKEPNGPSAITNVPGFTLARPRLKSPRSLIVMRNDEPSGAAESENGCDSRQRSRSRNRQLEPLPRPRIQPVQVAPADAQRYYSRRFPPHFCYPHPVPEEANQRLEHAKEQHELERRNIERGPERGRQRTAEKVAAGRHLMRPSQEDAEVGHQMDAVPGFVAEPAPHDYDRRECHKNQEHRAREGLHHARIGCQERIQLGKDGDAGSAVRSRQ